MTRASHETAEKSYVGLTGCPICGKDSGVVLDRRLRPTFKYGERYPMMCAECEKIVKLGGVFLIEVRDGETGENPYRTGYMVGMAKQWSDRTGVKGPAAYIEVSQLKELLGDQYGKEVEHGN